MATRTKAGPAILSAGPWKGVRNTTDPFDDSPDYLVDATNCYIPDPQGGSGLYARLGFALTNSGAEIGSGSQAAVGVWNHVGLSGTTSRFIAEGGKLYRANNTLTSYTDVTPVGVAISTTATRVFMLSFADTLIVMDGVNRPWIGTNLTSTPITGTYIDYDGSGTAWTTQHMAVYGGALFFILKSVGGTNAQTTIAWSEINDPTTGYTQSSYDNTWTLEQTGASPLYALASTNVALYYFRDYAIGAIAGAVGPNLSSTATHDAVSVNVGTRAPAGIAQYGETIFFCDTDGRPQRLVPGAAPEPIWLQLRSVIEGLYGYAKASTILLTICGVIEPTLNLYLVTIGQSSGGSVLPSVAQAFDAKTGVYVGQWAIAPGIGLNALGILNDADAQPRLVAIGGTTARTGGGYVWVQATPAAPVWTDNAAVPTISATTQRLGYSADLVLHADQATLVTGSDAACTVTAVGTGTPSTLQGTPSPATSQDGTYRLVCGLDAFGRGIELTVSPTTATSQWSLQQITMRAAASLAGPEDA